MGRAFGVVGLLLALVGCADGFQTLQQASEAGPGVRAAVTRPDGPGPLPAVVLLHGCGGPGPNLPGWTALLAAEGFLVAVPDQFGPRGIAEICTSQNPSTAMTGRYQDTMDLMRILQARPDVQADRVFVIGFSHGGEVVGGMVGQLFALLRTRAEVEGDLLRRPAGGIAIYPLCTALPTTLASPLLVVAAGDDDWTLASQCEGLVRLRAQGSIRPRLLVIPGARHDFDNPRLHGIVILHNVRNGNSPSGFGRVTLAHDAAATHQAQQAVLAFLREHR